MDQLTHDGPIAIATGNSRKEKKWTNKELQWSQFLETVEVTQKTSETQEEYRKMSKDEQDGRKDVGGFVGGKLKGGRRKNGFVEYRSLLTLDMDYAQPDVWDEIFMLYDYACCIYSTHKYTPENPRLRLVIPLMRVVTAEEYTAIARKVAGDLGIEMFDDTTYSAARLMYWPSTSTGGKYVFEYIDGPWMNPDEVLGSYEDWKDASSWPVSSRQQSVIKKSAEKQTDPTTKTGLIGAFCRTYSIIEALETFLGDVYSPCDIEGRYTFLGGSTSGGLILYDNDTFAFSHHGTDPISGKLVNAFDLVRVHKFGAQDDGVEENTPPSKRPSYKAMQDFVVDDVLVQETLNLERMAAIEADFGGEKVDSKRLFFKDDKFISAYMAEWFLKGHGAFIMNDDLYIYENGVYIRDERVFHKEATAALEAEFTMSRLREALAYIKNTVFRVTPEDAMNTGSWLNLLNGLLNLETLELKPHTPELKTIVQLSASYDPEADCSEIDVFLKAVVPADAITVVEEYAGYCLIPTMRYEKSLVLHGEGGNGKGTLIAMITAMLGDKNVANVSFQALTENRFATAQLFGKMANLHADIPNKTIESTAQFKEVTSGDMIQAEEKHKNPFSFRNRAKLIYSANEPPTSKDNTEGFHRKLLMIPFPTKFTNRKLRQSLFTPEGLSGLLLRALQGMQRLQKQGKFTESETVTASLLEYRNRSDTAAHFLDENCSFNDGEMTGKQVIYDAYRNFCSQWGNYPLSQGKFNTRLQAIHPEVKEYRQNGLRSWRGINLEVGNFLG